MGIPTTSSVDKDTLASMVETLKARENVDLLMSKLQTSAPLIYGAMVSERDEYMAKGIDGESGSKRMVAVVGVAHMSGIERGLMEMGWKKVGSCAAVSE